MAALLMLAEGAAFTHFSGLYLAFVASGLELYASIFTSNNSQSIAKFTYPGGRISQNFNTQANEYVAVWPPLVP
jgi:hypothetical protein